MSRTVAGARVLITGAARGTGRMYAERAVAERAISVILWDGDAGALAATAAELGELAGEVTRVASYVVDVADLGAIAQTAQRVRTEVGNPDVVVNNAGLVRDKYFWEHDNGEDIRPTMQVNAMAPMYITREFLPAMIDDAYRQARIVNVASAAGTAAIPGRSVYAASQAALIGWSDSLRRELEQQDHGNVKVTTVRAGRITPGVLDGTKNPFPGPALSPEYVVDRVWRAMLSGKPMLTLPGTTGLAQALRGALPARDAGTADDLGARRSLEKRVD